MDTVCADGCHTTQPLVCMGVHSFDRVIECPTRRPIVVHGFDGQKSHVEEVKTTVYNHFPHLKPLDSVDKKDNSPDVLVSNIKSSFVYTHAALTDKAEDGDIGYFTIRKDEGGALVKGSQKGTAPVSITTVDNYCEKHNISKVDILKIDAEGLDREVVMGASRTLSDRKVKMLVVEFEHYNEWADTLEMLDTKFGFDCYSNGVRNLMIRLTKCWNENLATKCSNPSGKCYYGDLGRNPRNMIGGNVYCVHRTRAAALNHNFDEMSLYHYQHVERRGDLFVDNFVGLDGKAKRYFDGETGQVRMKVDFPDGFERNFGRHVGAFNRKEAQAS